MTANQPRIMFAAPSSGSGKTTITCAVIRALQKKGVITSACKCGPDFIDPMFHSKVLGAGSTNLDLFLMGAGACKSLLAEKSRGSAVTVIEGVMGYYDGIGTTDTYSSYHLAMETGTPVILVVKCGGISATLAAILNGIVDFRSGSNVKGVIFNGVRPAMYQFYKSIIESQSKVAVLGYMPDMPDCRFESRHLGLVTADEICGLQTKIDRLAAQAANSIDLDALMKIAVSAAPFEFLTQDIKERFNVKIAVAKDRAFCFYYDDSLAVLEKMGAEIVNFSPLADTSLPDCDGMIIGGGYPELYLEQLSQNTGMLQSIKGAVALHKPCIAECGGFMYLHNSIRDRNGCAFKMAAVIGAEAYMTESLTRFGYVTLTARRDSLLCAAGDSIAAHEFHYSDSTACGDGFTAQKPLGTKKYDCISAGPSLFAGYPHIHFMGNLSFAARFLSECEKVKNSKTK